MWVYEQRTGKLYDGTRLAGLGYSGHGEGKNNPAMQHVPRMGPIPRGLYDIALDTTVKGKGPLVLRLTPRPGTEMFGRSGFLMHADSIEHPGEASEGCIVQGYPVRERVLRGSSLIQVVEG